MPGMDGWKTLAVLKKLSPGIPFILASGYDKAKVMSGDHPELPQAFLGKPYMLNGLSDAICFAMAKRSGELVARGSGKKEVVRREYLERISKNEARNPDSSLPDQPYN